MKNSVFGLFYEGIKAGKGELATRGFKTCVKMIATAGSQALEFTGNCTITCYAEKIIDTRVVSRYGIFMINWNVSLQKEQKPGYK